MVKFDVKSVKGAFFDRARVVNAMDRATRNALNEFGRRVRAAAQRSLKYGKASSRPGQPPAAHRTGTRVTKSKSTGRTRVRAVSYLREFLFYAYDADAKQAVIGPARLNGTVDPRSLHALEYGGRAAIFAKGKTQEATVRARPFMRPALDARLPELPGLWKDSIR